MLTIVRVAGEASCVCGHHFIRQLLQRGKHTVESDDLTMFIIQGTDCRIHDIFFADLLFCFLCLFHDGEYRIDDRFQIHLFFYKSHTVSSLSFLS